MQLTNATLRFFRYCYINRQGYRCIVIFSHLSVVNTKHGELGRSMSMVFGYRSRKLGFCFRQHCEMEVHFSNAKLMIIIGNIKIITGARNVVLATVPSLQSLPFFSLHRLDGTKRND